MNPKNNSNSSNSNKNNNNDNNNHQRRTSKNDEKSTTSSRSAISTSSSSESNPNKSKKKMKRALANNLRVATHQKLISQQIKSLNESSGSQTQSSTETSKVPSVLVSNKLITGLAPDVHSNMSSPSTPISFVDSKDKKQMKRNYNANYDVSMNAAVQQKLKDLSLNNEQQKGSQMNETLTYLDQNKKIHQKMMCHKLFDASVGTSTNHHRSSSTSYFDTSSSSISSQGQISSSSSFIGTSSATGPSRIVQSGQHLNNISALPILKDHPLTPTAKKSSYEDMFEDVKPKSKRISKMADIISIRFALTAPPEIILSIFYYLNRKELLSIASRVCKEWYELAHHRQLWWYQTFISNPYYYDSKHTRKQNAKKQSIKDSSSQNEKNQSKKNVSKQVKKEVQLYNYKKNYYIQDKTDSFIKNQQLFLNCRDYFFESILVDRLKDPVEQQQTKGSGASSESTSPLSATSRRPSFLQKFFRSSSPTTPKKTNSPSSPKSAMRFTSKDLFQRDTYCESTLMTNCEADLPTRRYRHSVTMVEKPDGRRIIYIIGGIKGGDFSVRSGEDYVFALECFSSNASNKASQTTFDLNNLQTAASEFVQPISPINTGVFEDLSDTSSERSSNSSPSDKIFETTGNSSSKSRSSHSHKPTMIRFQKVKVKGKPAHIGKHSATLFDQKIYIFGGVESGIVTNNLYIFDTDTNIWYKDTKEHKVVPEPRTNHSTCRIGKYMYLISGGVGDNMVPTNEVWQFDTEKMEWCEIKCINQDIFTPRLGFALTQINKKILIYGGGYWYQRNFVDRYWKEKYTDMFIFDTETTVWSKIETKGEHPKTGTFPGSCRVGSDWYIVGGAYENEISNELFVFDTISFKWTRLNQKFYGGDSLTATYFPHASENKIFVFGGYCYQPLEKFEIFKLKYKDYLGSSGIRSIIQYKDT